MSQFDRKLEELFNDYVDTEVNSENENALSIFNMMGFETSELDPDDDDMELWERCYNHLQCLSSDVIWSKINENRIDDLKPSEILFDMFWEASDVHDDWARDFIENMAESCGDYTHPSGCFEDVIQGGCVSGTVGMLIYHDDCKKIYIDNMDDIENYVCTIEDDLGVGIKNLHHLPRYTFVCWLCYEYLSYQINSKLFNN